MVRKRPMDMLVGNTLNTIPYQVKKPELIQVNKALSRADTRHDIPVRFGVGFFTTTLNGVYGEQIEISPGPPVILYQDSSSSNDIFTNAIKNQVRSYQVDSVNFNFEGNPYALPSLYGPIPKHSSIPYFMRTLETGTELLQGDTKVVVVSDNASADAVQRSISRHSQIFLRNANSQPHPANITEAVTLASIIDMAGKSVPGNWAELFHAWWDDCVGEFDTFNINLTAIGAVNMGGTGLIISRTATQQMRSRGDKGYLRVGIVVEGRAPITIDYDLNQPSLEQSIMRNQNGGYIFVSGKNIAKVFFEEYNTLLTPGTDRNPGGRAMEHLLTNVASAVSKATRIPIVDTRIHVENIFRTLYYNCDLIGKYFIVGKLIGDLLCPLCCDDKWYTISNDNLMIARCLILSKRALFSKHSNQFSGFYFFVPEEPPATLAQAQVLAQQVPLLEQRHIAAENQAVLLETEAQGVTTRSQAAAAQVAAAQSAAESAAQAVHNAQAQVAAEEAALHAQALQTQALALHAQAVELQTQAQGVTTRAQAARVQAQVAAALHAQVVALNTEAQQVAPTQAAAVAERNQRNQELVRRIEEDGGRLRQIIDKIIDKRIEQINAEVNREKILNTNSGIVIDEDIYIKHKLYCTSKIESIFQKFLNDEITFNIASCEIKKINKSIGTNPSDISLNNPTHMRLLRRVRFNDHGEIMIGGTGTQETITVKWKKEIFDNISVDLSAPVSELKVQLFSLSGVAAEKQKLIMGGKTLKDEMSLESYGVKNGSVLQMIGNASEMWVKPDIKEVTFVDDLPASEQATDNSQYPSKNGSKICGAYAKVNIQVFESGMINKIKEILEGNNEKRNFIFGIGNQPIKVLPPKAENFFQSLKLFLEKVISKIESKDNLFILQIFGDVISHLEDILSINSSIIFQPNDNIVIPFCIDYDKVSHACLLLDIKVEDITIEGEGFEKQFDNFKELFPNVPERILPIADIPTIVNNLVTSILKKIEENKVILGEVLPLDEALPLDEDIQEESRPPDIYDLLKGNNLETILSNNKDNINDLYFNAIPEVLGIMHSYGVFTQAEEVEFYIIQAIIENKNKDSREHEIITKSIYSLYQNITVLYGIYVYDAEILKTFIENINLKNNMIQYDGGFNSLHTIMDYRCDIEFEEMIKNSTTYVSLNQFMQQQEQKMKELEQSYKTMLDTERLHALGLNETIKANQLTRLQTAGMGGGKNNRISNPKHNTKYRKNYKKFVSKYIIKKKKNNNKKNKKNNKKNNKNKTRKNKRLTKSTPNTKRNNKTLKNKKGKSKSSNHKSKYNKKTKTNYYSSYRHNKTLKH
jgi:hypothetical protein